MANVSAPFGLMPIQDLNGAPYNGRTTRYYVPLANTSAIYIGDPVALQEVAGGATGAPDANVDGVQAVGKCAASDTRWLGPVVGIEVVTPGISNTGTSLALEQIFIPATKTKDYYVYVADDPNLIFEIQGDATATNQVAAKSSYNADITVAVPSSGNQSATVMASGGMAVTATLPLKLIGLSLRKFTGGNVFGAYAVWRCKINNHQLANIVAADAA